MTADSVRKRAVRAHMAATGLSYTAAARALDAPYKPDCISISECMQENGFTYAEAVAFLEDPGNEIMCEVCGWTYKMVCPECAKGCGCEWRCSGWRHREWNYDDDPEPEPCYNCGTRGCPGYCDDYQTYNLRDDGRCVWCGNEGCGETCKDPDFAGLPEP
jgi:hypothetical protein